MSLGGVVIPGLRRVLFLLNGHPALHLGARKLLAPCYVPAFAQYCETYAAWRRAADVVASMTAVCMNAASLLSGRRRDDPSARW